MEIKEKTFSVASPAHLNLINIGGSVEIRPGADWEIHVTATKNANTGDTQRTEIEFSQEMDGTVKVATRFPEGAWSWLFGSLPCRVDYVVKAPRKCCLKINAVSSEILAEEFDSKFSFQAELHAITGNLSTKLPATSISQQNGNQTIEVQGGGVRVTLQSVSGNLSLAS